MKLYEIIDDEEAQLNDTLIGATVNNRIITADTKDKSWHGNFVYGGSALTSLKGAPKEIIGDGCFDCHDNRLKSLKGAPQKIADYFDCSCNKLKTLKGGPVEVGGYYNCAENKLTSLEGAPKVCHGPFYCFRNELTTLEGIPSDINGSLDCAHNKLSNLKDIHKMVNRIYGTIYLSGNPIKSHVLGLLLIKDLIFIDATDKNVNWAIIIRKHLSKGREGVLAAQSELIEAGLEEYAQL